LTYRCVLNVCCEMYCIYLVVLYNTYNNTRYEWKLWNCIYCLDQKKLGLQFYALFIVVVYCCLVPSRVTQSHGRTVYLGIEQQADAAADIT
jgi:hypothetical protein